MKKLKVVTVVGTRPEIIRLCMLIPKLDKYTDHILVHTGQNYDPMLKDVFFDDLGVRAPNYYLDVATTSLGAVMADVLRKSEEVFISEEPDAVMILGDTNSAISAIVAERMHIPVYHMEAGNRSFDNNVPEELNRRMVDHIASFNLPYNDFSLRNLLSEGLDPRFIQKTGSPMAEIYQHYKSKIQASNVLDVLGLKRGQYFLFSVHRQENVDEIGRLEKVLDCMKAVRDSWGLPIIVSTHPRTKAKLLGLKSGADDVIFHAPFGYLDYNKLQLESKCVISDSGTLAEEAAIQGFRAVSLRDSTERPEALESATMLMSGLEPNNLLRCIQIALESEKDKSVPAGYEQKGFSDAVINFLFSTVGQHRDWKGLHVRPNA